MAILLALSWATNVTVVDARELPVQLALTDETNPPTGTRSLGSFPDMTLVNWERRSFAGHTDYQLIRRDGQTVLRGSAMGSASVLYKRQKVSLKKTPWLAWSWTVDNVIGEANELIKSGDDFAARLYVVVQTGFLPWETVALNYVWSSHQPINTHWVSPYTKRSHMIALQTGAPPMGSWAHEKRNIADDFKTYLGMDVSSLDGYAIMVDSDNTGQPVTGYFGDIQFF